MLLYLDTWRHKSKKEKEKIERYQELKREIKRMRNISSIDIIPLVVGTLGSTSKKLKNFIEEVGVVISTVVLCLYCRKQHY